MFKRLFVVDREPMVLKFFEVMYQKKEVEVFTFSNLDCKHFMVDFRPDVILLDLSVNGIDESYLQQLRELKAPIIGIGKGKQLDPDESLASYFQGVIHKPFQAMEISHLIEAQLAK